MPANFDKDVFLWNSFESDAMPAFRGLIRSNEGSSRFAALGDVSRLCSSNQVRDRGFSYRMRGEIEMTVEQKVALALRCDDAKMSLVVRRNEKVCAVFTKG